MVGTVAIGQLTPEHLPTRREFGFPYALAVLSRQPSGDVYVWTGSATPKDLERPFKWMSVTKFLVATAFWVQSLPSAGSTVMPLDLAVGPPAPPGVRLVDLLAHCSGLPFDAPADNMGIRFGIANPDERAIEPFTKRVYSNYNFELAGAFAESRLGVPWNDWVGRVITGPLGMNGTKLSDSPAWGAVGPIVDLARLAAEMLSPSRSGLAAADIDRFSAPVHPGLRGVLPGYGHQKDNLWGAGVEIHGAKTPHYLPESFPPEVIGHFGQSGSFIWVDREAGAAGVFLGAEPFGPVHKALWPRLNAEIRQLALLAR